MGTIVTMDIYSDAGIARSVIEPQFGAAIEVLHRADSIFSLWEVDSPMSRLRCGESSLDDVPPQVRDVLDACLFAREVSGGWFDPWAMPGGIDPTGYVKGWAAQSAMESLKASGVCGAVVNAAGDIASFGTYLGAQLFRFGIADPFDPTRLSCVVALSGALATSGTYERGAHLVDPSSGKAEARVESASVCGPDLGLADALATALAVEGEAGLSRIEGIAHYEAMTISHSGVRRMTKGFPIVSVST